MKLTITANIRADPKGKNISPISNWLLKLILSRPLRSTLFQKSSTITPFWKFISGSHLKWAVRVKQPEDLSDNNCVPLRPVAHPLLICCWTWMQLIGILIDKILYLDEVPLQFRLVDSLEVVQKCRLPILYTSVLATWLDALARYTLNIWLLKSEKETVVYTHPLRILFGVEA
jgi:hypothetical protein